jgi:hypothetical protein
MVAVLLIPATAMAGGWALSSFEQLPDSFEAGSTYDLEYTILQHGQTPVDVGDSEVRIIAADGTVTAFDAVPTGEVGKYAVSITFPESGAWRWEVTQGGFATHEMGTIDVAAPAVAETATTETASSMLRWLLPAALALVVALAVLQGSALFGARRAGAGRLETQVSAD